MEPKPLLWTEGVEKRFGGFQALAGVDTHVSRNEVLGIIGPNGAGKTTLFNVIAGLFRPTVGRVFFEGVEITRASPHRRARMGIARTFQLIHPFVSMSISDNVRTAAMACGLPMREIPARVDDVLERLGMTSIADKFGADINAVEGKRLEVARALVTRPKVILLDEIFSGLNNEEVQELVALVHQTKAEGVSVLVIEHNVRAIKAVSDRVVAIDAGRVVSQGAPESVLSDPQVIESYLGQRAGA